MNRINGESNSKPISARVKSKSRLKTFLYMLLLCIYFKPSGFVARVASLSSKPFTIL